MKLKESKETQETIVTDDKKPNHLYEYLDYVSYGVKQLAVLHTNRHSKLCIHAPSVDFAVLEKLFNWKDDKDHNLVHKGTFADYVSTAFDVCSDWIDRYNEVSKHVGAFERSVLERTLPHVSILADIMQAYRDLQDDEEAAKKKWCKCE